MNFRQMRYFCDVVEAGSAVAAARRLHVAPTAMSMQLSQLEAALGGELFDRARRPMEPTASDGSSIPELFSSAESTSTEEQGTDPQLDELRAAGCATILQEHASGAVRSRPVLTRLLREIGRGETLVVVRLDRLARSVSHLLSVIEQLEASGAHFRSLHDPVDTTTPQGMPRSPLLPMPPPCRLRPDQRQQPRRCEVLRCCC